MVVKMMTWIAIYLVCGIAIALWLQKPHKEPNTVSSIEWLIVVAIWPVIVVVFPFMVYQVFKRKMKEWDI